LDSKVVQKLAPEWLAHRFDESRNEVRFVDYDRATRAAAPFLTDDYLPSREYRAEPRDRAKLLAPARAPIHFVFHSGFCCSTLFAQCLDQRGLATAFSEPMILNDIVGWRKRGAPPVEVGRLLDDALAFLARPFDGDQAAVVKPSTVVNGLAPAMTGIRPDARAIVMHAPLDDFITSIAKKGLEGRLWVRELFLNMRRDGLIGGLGFSDEQFFGQTDLQIAGATWLAQQSLFGDLMNRFPERVRSLESTAFLDRPATAIEAGAKWLGLALTPDHIRAAEQGPLSRNSKDRKRYNRGAREAEYKAARAAYGDEIDKVAVWARAVADSAGLPIKLDRPLI
jgi:hypothetical protein